MNTFESKLRKFLFRYFINKQQTVACNSCKHLAIFESSKQQWFKWTSLKRFLCIQDEDSSAHWKTSSASLYTAMIWFEEHMCIYGSSL